MGYSCDFCSKDALDHKVVCMRCFSFFGRIIAGLEKPSAKKQVLPRDIKGEKEPPKIQKLKKTSENPNNPVENAKDSTKKSDRQKKFEETMSKKSSDPADLLTKCATCEFNFLTAKKISCTENKEPKTCGH